MSHVVVPFAMLRQWWGENECHSIRQRELGLGPDEYSRHVASQVADFLKNPSAVTSQASASWKDSLDNLVKTSKMACDLVVAALEKKKLSENRFVAQLERDINDAIKQQKLKLAQDICDVTCTNFSSIKHELKTYVTVPQEFEDETSIVPVSLLERYTRVTSANDQWHVECELKEILNNQWFVVYLAEENRNSFEVLKHMDMLRLMLSEETSFHHDSILNHIVHMSRIYKPIFETPYLDTLRGKSLEEFNTVQA